jgi:hypothetical protein
MANWVKKWWGVSVGTALLAAMGFAAGCSLESTPKGGSKAGQKSGDKDDHDHDGHDHHDHDHAHMHGPNGGPVLELGDEEYHAEWLHDDETGKVTVVLLDKAAKKEVTIESAEIAIEVKIADSEKTYALPAAGGTDKPSARFELEDKALLAALEGAGQEGTEAVLKVTINGKEYKAKFEPHEH